MVLWLQEMYEPLGFSFKTTKKLFQEQGLNNPEQFCLLTGKK